MLKLLNKYMVIIGCLLSVPYSIADHSINREDQLKAVYLYHFTELTRWSAEQKNRDNLNICLWEANGVKPFLDVLSQEKVNGQQILIRIITDIDEANVCQIIYFNELSAPFLQQSPLPVKTGTLLVGNNQLFIDRGGSISFIHKQNKIRLLINLKQIRKSGLDMSSKLLRISGVIE